MLKSEERRRIIGKPGSPGEAQCCGGLNPGGIERWLLEREKPPHVVRYQPGNVSGATLEPQQFEAPVIAGILVSMIVSWMDNRK
ncbi:MAG: type I toxin-antitoxin system toxin Ldr family protein [Klebsiella grimontii]|nr:type I toxin-antitoxin system toxin Ldr family protein [Klebsiella grimontii]